MKVGSCPGPQAGISLRKLITHYFVSLLLKCVLVPLRTVHLIFSQRLTYFHANNTSDEQEGLTNSLNMFSSALTPSLVNSASIFNSSFE